MGFSFSKEELAAMVARGATIKDHAVRLAAPVSVETRMSWSEKEFQAEVMKLAKSFGWGPIYHTWLSVRSEKGFPDLVMIRGQRIIWVELKKQKGKETPEQKAWRQALLDAGEAVYLWRPSNWEEIEATLAR